jgi:hypothetical protein
VLAELIERYGEDAVVTARPYVRDSGETLRWFLEIDGNDVPDVDLQIAEQAEPHGTKVMLLLHHDGEVVELHRWSTETYPHGPAAVVRRLGDLG